MYIENIVIDTIRIKMDAKKSKERIPICHKCRVKSYLKFTLGQFTRNYTQTTKRGLLTTNKG